MFLLTNIKLFDVIDEFLLQTVFIIFHIRNLLQTFNDALANLWYTALLIRLNTLHISLNVIKLLIKLLLKRFTQGASS